MKFSWSMIIIVILVALGTAFLIFNQLPEEQILLSDDGLFRINAWLGEGTDIDLNLDTELVGPFTAVVGPVYKLTPNGSQLTALATIEIGYTDEMLGGVDPGELTIGFYDEEVEAWRSVSSELDRTNKRLTVAVDHLSSWAVLIDRQVGIANKVNDVIHEVGNDIPVGATGLTVEIAYALGEGDYVLLTGPVLSGGCGGVYERGQETYVNTKETEAAAMVDGIQTTVRFKVIGIWEIGDGCLAANLFTNQ